MTKKPVIYREFDYVGYGSDYVMSYRSSPISLENWDYSSTAKFIIVKGLKQIPMVGGVLSGLVNAFWPKKKDNVWEETLKEIRQYIDSQNLKVIQGILNGEILEIQGKIEHVTELLEKYPNTKESYDAYKDLAQYLDSKQKKFEAFDSETNYQLIPMYASMILLQASYWRTGIDRRNDIGLTNIDIESLSKLISDLVFKSREYINRVYAEAEERVYENASPVDVTNYMYSVRGYCLLHGVETVEIIDCIRKLGVDQGFNIDVVSYSTVVGTITNRVRTQALTPDDEMKEPLRPKWIDGEINQIASITGYIGPYINSRPTIGGLSVVFENGSSYKMGDVSGTSYSIELNENTISTVEVWYQGLLEEVLFTLSDGRSLQIGLKSSSANYKKFEVEGHYVSGIYLDRDEKTYRGRAANISVSYHLCNREA